MDSCTVIAITNQKGGVGKTTTTANLGIGLARQGKRVLLIDLDPQASLTLSLGFTNPDNLSPTVTDVMQDLMINGENTQRFEFLKNKEGVDVLPANIELCGVEVQLVNEMSRELILKSYVDEIRKDYDYILIDCMPSLGMLTFNALCCADKVIIPAQPEFLSAKGLEQLIKTIGLVKKRLNPEMKIDGILLTMVDSRTRFAREVSELIEGTYSKITRIYSTVIPRSVRAAETSAEGISIFLHDPHGKVAEAYDNLAKEVSGCAKEKLRSKNHSERIR